MTQEEKLKEAKRLYETANADQRYVLERLFPVLAESKDERIRKTLKEYFINSFQNNGVAAICGMHIKDILAWLEKQGKNNMSISEATKQELEDNLNKALEKETPESCNEFLEKQGEQKTAENKDYSAPFDIEIPFGAKDSELIQETIRIPDGCYAFIEGNEIVIKKGEKPAAWSEEDELMLNDILMCGERHCYLDARNISWLKSLKDRYTWKPSDEQMETLENVRKILHTNKGIYSKANHFMFNFEELIRTLKKLREG